MTHSKLKKICVSVFQLGLYIGERHMKPVYLPTIFLGFVLAAPCSFAGSATWKFFHFPFSRSWDLASNWSPETVPNGPLDTATFETCLTPDVSISGDIGVDSIVFNSNGVSEPTSFTITANLLAVGSDITNNSGVTQSFISDLEIQLQGSRVLGGGIVFTNNSLIDLMCCADMGNAAVYNNGGTSSNTGGALTYFEDSSEADTATFTNRGGTVSGAGGGNTIFNGCDGYGCVPSSADNGTFINQGATIRGATGGCTLFNFNSTASNATLIANTGTNGGGGGFILFQDISDGGTARVKVFGNGYLDISGHHLGMTIGSIEGSGLVFLGANGLAVGTNNLNTTFSGLVQDGGSNGGTGGRLFKIGKGKLTLAKSNAYTGGTSITAGTLSVTNTTGSATGSGAVQANLGATLEGVGIIAGAVTLGDFEGHTPATLLGGNNATSPGTLTIHNTLTFNDPSTYKCVLNRSTGKASKIIAAGVSINSNVPFTFVDVGAASLPVGTVLTVISNTSASPIAGTFSNLSNGLTFTSKGTKFKVNYTGGTGNDLVLRVVP